MIKFFRHIRKSLLMENKTGKYFKYAIGEIILVMIGILLALQVNNWNENRLAKLEEKSILSNLNQEFLQNKEALKNDLKVSDEAYQSGLIIMDLIGKSRTELESINTDSILYKTVEYNSFNPSENALSDLLQSGRLQILQNEKLKDLLYQWTRILKRTVENFEGFDNKIENDVLTYLTTHHSLKDIDYYGTLKWKSKSVLKIDKLKIFEDIEYENLMDDALYRLLNYLDNLKEAQAIIDNIIQETNFHD